ncbi:MAG TPA: pantoate--beta-alanine ligase [Bacteroidia bacterium]|jgi:pantoate--beta-alanine ligase|nr:pantoate--beta-alanine ligase [Bacteroidia bacterium]
MIFFYLKQPFQEYLAKSRKEGQIIGFVPTMGALHQGHISLINAAKESCDLVVCSIFVNPTQFNNLQDLEKYPRTLDTDSLMLERVGCDILFAPETSEIYTATELQMKALNREDKSWMGGKTVDFGRLDKVMEGAQRPGHFNGVAQVVSKLFQIVQPDKAFFGQKDFQQLAVIKSMVQQMEINVEIIPCPILREQDGLAMSSRNVRLTPEQRKIVPSISKILFTIKELQTTHSPAQLKTIVSDFFARQAEMKLAYFEIVDANTLGSVSDFKQHTGVVACIAVEIGSLRLIDNVVLK